MKIEKQKKWEAKAHLSATTTIILIMLSWQHQHPSFFHLPDKQTKLSPLLASFSPISTESSTLSLSLVLPIPKPICCFLFLIKEERKRYAIGGVEPNLLLQGSTRPRHLLQLSSPSCYSLQGFLLLSLSQLFFPFFLCVDVE